MNCTDIVIILSKKAHSNGEKRAVVICRHNTPGGVLINWKVCGQASNFQPFEDPIFSLL